MNPLLWTNWTENTDHMFEASRWEHCLTVKSTQKSVRNGTKGNENRTEQNKEGTQ